MSNTIRIASLMQDKIEFDKTEISHGSIVGRNRGVNLAACFALEKRVSFFGPEVGRDAPEIATRANATFFNIDTVQGQYNGRYFEKLSILSKMIPDGVLEITVESLNASIRLIRTGALSEKIDSKFAAVPFVVARESSDNPVLVRNEAFDQSKFLGVTANALMAAASGKAQSVEFSVEAVAESQAPSAKYDMVLDNLVVKMGTETIPSIDLGGIRVQLDNSGRLVSLEINNASKVVDMSALVNGGMSVEVENEDLLMPLPYAEVTNSIA